MLTMRHPVRTALRLVLGLVILALVYTCHTTKQGPEAVARQWASDVGLVHAPVNSASSYAFESTYGTPSTPTRWSDCSDISYEVNLTHAPANALTVLNAELSRVHALTGLSFTYAGSAPAVNFATYDASGVPAPVIFAWEPANHLLDALNVNATTIPIVNPSHANYVSAIVLFNDDMNAFFVKDPIFAANLVLHEIGHVVGLSDVNDPTQVMNASLSPSVTSDALGAGDLAGLRLLGTSGCS